MKLKKLNSLHSYKGFPLKILHFKRSKWSRFKKSSWRNRLRLYNFSKIALSASRFRRWNKLSQMYKNKLLTRRLIKYYLSQTFNSSSSNDTIREDLQVEKIFKYLFTTNNLLRYSYQSHSQNNSKSNLFKKTVYLNKSLSPLRESNILSKGDIISTKLFEKNLKTNTLKYRKKGKIYPFFQYDAYGQNILVIKNPLDLSKHDISLSISEFIELEKLI